MPFASLNVIKRNLVVVVVVVVVGPGGGGVVVSLRWVSGEVVVRQRSVS